MPMPPAIALRIGATVTASGTLTPGVHTPIDATTGPLTLTLPTNPRYGAYLGVEKRDTTTNIITITGTLRGGATSVTLARQDEALEFHADSAGAWWPRLNHLPKGYVQAQVAIETARAQAAEQAISAALLTELPEWQPNTPYTAGFLVVNPSGQIVQAITGFTSGATYNAANWTILSLTVQTVAAMIAAQATADAATYLGLVTANADGSINFPDSGWGVGTDGSPTYYGVGQVPTGQRAYGPVFASDGSAVLIPTGV